MTNEQPSLVFAIPGYEQVADEIVAAGCGRLERGKDQRKTHSDGRPWHAFVSDVARREVIVVGDTMTDTNLVTMLKLGHSARYWKASKLTFLITYHGDARQEKHHGQGECVDGLFSSLMFTSIPQCLPGGNEVFLVDIHADTVTGFFLGGNMRCFNIEVLKELIKQIASQHFAGKCMLAAPDATRGKVVSKVAKALDLKFAIAAKGRATKQEEANGKTETSGLIGYVRGRNVLVSDDMGVSFSSAIGVGEFLKKKGAKEVVLLVTHGVIPDANYVQNLIDSGIYSCLYLTDTLHRVYELQKQFPDFVRVIPLAPLVTPYLLG